VKKAYEKRSGGWMEFVAGKIETAERRGGKRNKNRAGVEY
jgi:hypothetical protein